MRLYSDPKRYVPARWVAAAGIGLCTALFLAYLAENAGSTATKAALLWPFTLVSWTVNLIFGSLPSDPEAMDLPHILGAFIAFWASIALYSFVANWLLRVLARPVKNLSGRFPDVGT
jgi:hypothetical protein